MGMGRESIGYTLNRLFYSIKLSRAAEVGNGEGISAVERREVAHQRLFLSIENMAKKQP
jgi:hypothetical protein